MAASAARRSSRTPPSLEMLFRAGMRHPERSYATLALVTLTNICEGGICDHLGGGFARYSTDERWLVPHFEKMLYDNAQILELLAVAHHITGEPLYRQARRGAGRLARS